MEISKEIKDSIRAFKTARMHEKIIRDWLGEQ